MSRNGMRPTPHGSLEAAMVDSPDQFMIQVGDYSLAYSTPT